MGKLGYAILGFMLGYLIFSWIFLPLTINSINNKLHEMIKLLKEK